MENSNKKESIYDFCSEEINKVTDMSNIVLNVVFLIIGIILLVIGIVWKGNNSISLSLLVCGATLAVLGLVMIFSGKKKYVLKSTDQKIKKNEVFFDESSVSSLTKMFDTHNFENLSKIQSVDNTGVKIEYLTTSDGNYFSMVLLKYVPYNFEPISDVIKYQNEDAKKMRDCLKDIYDHKIACKY